MATGLRLVTERLAGQPVLDSGNNEELMFVQSGVSIVLGNGLPEFPGTLYISNKQIVWLSDTDREKGYAVDFVSVSLHAVSRDPESDSSPCIYTQIETGADDDEMEDSDSESNEILNLSKINEMRLVPSDPNQLDTLFATLCQCAELNPDPVEAFQGEEEVGHNWVFSADQLEDDEEDEDPDSTPAIGAYGNQDLAHSVVQVHTSWTSLPTELTNLILKKLILVQDYIRFSVVCKKWFSVGQDQKLQRMKTSIFTQPPVLLIPNTSSFFDIVERKYYISSGSKYDDIVLGSSFGWLVMVSERFTTDLIDPLYGNTHKRKSFTMNLVNPFSGKKIMLPQILMEYDTLIYKIILSDDPSLNPDNYIVVAICKYERTLAFLRSGDESWTHFNRETLCYVNDILFCEGQLYARDHKNGLTKVNFEKDSSDHDLEILMPKENNFDMTFNYYLVESVDGELLLVRRFYSENAREGKHYTKGFQVLKLVKENEQVKLTKIESLGNQTLFLGYKFSMSILADDFSPHIKRNSIYYTDDSIHDVTVEGHNIRLQFFDDIGIFSLEDESLYSYFDGPVDEQFLPAIWISPTLQ
ncbi:hypothetical protein ACJIZ3_022501 [Penstemon smallii]|uniref:DUF295 domain-containing protein n=1 Tax=Penstemon smallii TaxID=265156 RepID=A0ABD3TNI1_9LAMI